MASSCRSWRSGRTSSASIPSLGIESATLFDREFDSSPAFGGRVGVRWRSASGLTVGGEFDVLTYTPDGPPGTVRGSGQSVVGPIPEMDFELPLVDARATNAIGSAVVGWTSDDEAAGRWGVLVGGGGGVARTSAEFEILELFGRPLDDTQTSGLFQVFGRGEVMLSSRVGVFGEYRFTRTEVDFEFEPNRSDVFTFQTHFVLGGLSVGF